MGAMEVMLFRLISGFFITILLMKHAVIIWLEDGLILKTLRFVMLKLSVKIVIILIVEANALFPDIPKCTVLKHMDLSKENKL